ncbi:cutinase family protein [Mycolicibacterium sp. P1-18]|uniref:cutinase family protein n=1 Tax=Mycolicibacterium sp. P1-18 TaxID=2024615 RepID=UPI0011F1BD3B|nr:cutinase family protein [Mycolicibacterium sp. P1-18]KAA0102359.1 cutinase family protein [Mycolicibacterium sp. P1-18]
MTLRSLTPVLGVAAALTWSLVSGAAPGASAEPLPSASNPGCSDVDLVFARGTGEPAGLGFVGDAFADSLRNKLGNKSMNVYAVQYPATIDFPRAVDGINDAAAHIQATVANCPKTKIVLGGFSQGAAVAGFVTADVVPPGAADSGVTGPLPPTVADHVAAVALFGKPSPRFMSFVNQPDIVIGPKYAGKTLDSCVPGDPICSDGGDFSLHNQYVGDGRVDQAADYVVGKLGYAVATPPPPPPADAPLLPPPPPVDAPPPPAPDAALPPAPPAPAPAPAPAPVAAPVPAPGAPLPA